MLLATARVELGLSLREFYAFTPRLFAAFLQRHRDQITRQFEHTEYMFAQLTSWVANTGFRTAEKPTQTRDFMPSEWAKTAHVHRASTPLQKKRTTRKRREDLMRSLRLIFP